ncbi:hypothetical protein B8b_05 [Pseudoalteromonas phage B8b]|uniref:Uncharacterized protein n=1 Tax=Pseudoalteromonas phage B8b TaxID=1506997 RepID=A0A076G5D2_9CAUD|nr:hypothetical protein B8b_05 [Pseudoalteromonas phage B8b]|tara:strand:+ start:3326 stop:3661 length:336 start_codon:yes stop_codon:yes gene_type:complete
MVNLKISKLIPAETLKSEVKLNRKLSHLNGVQTGDTTGELLMVIGKAMRDGEAQIGGKSGEEIAHKIKTCRHLIDYSLGLKHLIITKRNNISATLTYDIYMSEGEIFRSIS